MTRPLEPGPGKIPPDMDDGFISGYAHNALLERLDSIARDHRNETHRSFHFGLHKGLRLSISMIERDHTQLQSEKEKWIRELNEQLQKLIDIPADLFNIQNTIVEVLNGTVYGINMAIKERDRFIQQD